MRGTPESYSFTREYEPSETNKGYDARAIEVAWKLREFNRATLNSEAGQRVIRYPTFTPPGEKFPYEGTLQAHVDGSRKRGKQLLRIEESLRNVAKVPDLDYRLLNYVLKYHDLGELTEKSKSGEMDEDRPHGTKTKDDHRKEREQFLINQQIAEDPHILNMLDRVLTISESYEISAEGRFWKTSERLTFLETGRRLHRRLQGHAIDEVWENERSGIHLELATKTIDLNAIVRPDLLAWDVVRNSARDLGVSRDQEFCFVDEYLVRNREELMNIVREFLLDPEQNERLGRDLIQLDEERVKGMEEPDLIVYHGQLFLERLESLQARTIQPNALEDDSVIFLTEGEEQEIQAA